MESLRRSNTIPQMFRVLSLPLGCFVPERQQALCLFRGGQPLEAKEEADPRPAMSYRCKYRAKSRLRTPANLVPAITWALPF